MNSVQMLGRLTRDPEVRYTQTQKTMTTFTLAVNTTMRDETGKPKAIFVNCVAWGKTAEVIGSFVKKGHRLLVEGSLNIREWVDKETGKTMRALEINVMRSDFIELRKDTAPAGAAPAAPQAAPAAQPAPAAPIPFDEEVPF